MASFRIKKVILVESKFKLNPQIIPGDSTQYNLEVTMTTRNKVDNILVVSVEVKADAYGDDNALVLDTYVKMDGIFELESEFAGPGEDYLANVNAPAIVYPFIREHIASMSAKAGVDAILIPPFNFVEHYQKMLQKSKVEDSLTNNSTRENE